MKRQPIGSAAVFLRWFIFVAIVGGNELIFAVHRNRNPTYFFALNGYTVIREGIERVPGYTLVSQFCG